MQLATVKSRGWGGGLTAALLGCQSLVPLLCNGEADTLSTGDGHPWLVALEGESRRGEERVISPQKKVHRKRPLD